MHDTRMAESMALWVKRRCMGKDPGLPAEPKFHSVLASSTANQILNMKQDPVQTLEVTFGSALGDAFVGVETLVAACSAASASFDSFWPSRYPSTNCLTASL